MYAEAGRRPRHKNQRLIVAALRLSAGSEPNCFFSVNGGIGPHRVVRARRIVRSRLPPHLEVFGPNVLGTTFERRPFTTRFWAQSRWPCEPGRKTTIPTQTAAEDRRHCRMPTKQIASRTFFGLEPAHLTEPASTESIVLTNGSSAGSDFLLNVRPWRI